MIILWANALAAGPLTLEQMRALAPAALAKYLSAKSGDMFVESTVFDRTDGSRYARRSVTLASKPTFSGFKGICQASTVSISYPIPVSEADGLPGPVSPDEPEKREVGLRFRVVGEAPGGQADAADTARFDTECEAAGPVLDRKNERGARFFQLWYGTASDVDFAVRALRAAQAKAKTWEHVPECTRDVLLDADPMCRDPIRALMRLDWRRIEGLSVGTDKQSATTRHITFYFRRDPKEAPGADHIHVEMTAIKQYQDRPDIESIGLAGVTYVD